MYLLVGFVKVHRLCVVQFMDPYSTKIVFNENFDRMDLMRDFGQAAVLILTYNALIQFLLLQCLTSGSFIEMMLKGNYALHACLLGYIYSIAEEVRHLLGKCYS